MKLPVFTSTSSGPAMGASGGKVVTSSFKEFRALARLQPPLVAQRLLRLSRGVENSIKCSDPERYRRARWLEEAVAYIAKARPNHAGSQALQQCLTRLLRQSFQSLDWRRPLIAGLKSTRNRNSVKMRPSNSATS